MDIETLLENVLNALTAGITIGCIYGLIFGIMKVVNFAQGELLMPGMFASFYLVTGGGVLAFLGLVAGCTRAWHRPLAPRLRQCGCRWPHPVTCNGGD